VEQRFPHLLRRYQERYENSTYLKGAYRDMIRDRIATIRDRYGLAPGPPSPEMEHAPAIQPPLFDFGRTEPNVVA
jgi:hypothetical protein